MSGSITPGPSAGSRRRGLHATFWLLMAITSLWVGGNLGPPGWASSGSEIIRCPECNAEALEQKDGSYICDNDHRFFVDVGEEG